MRNLSTKGLVAAKAAYNKTYVEKDGPLKAALSAYVEASDDEPDFAASIAQVIKEESANEAACGWRSCTGCHETNEGAETGFYPYSKMFGCHVGSGCSECGGLGVVWDYYPKRVLDEMQQESIPSLTNKQLAASLDRIAARQSPAVAPATTTDERAVEALIEAQAWNCDAWPAWLHDIVHRTNEVADRLDMSSEQAHAYAVLAALALSQDTAGER